MMWGKFPRRSKYGNKKVQIDGYTFDSLKEGGYYQQLKLQKRAGAIADFKVHERITLIPAFKSCGERVRAMSYIPDFIVYGFGYTEFVDVKGMRTAEFDLKWKHLRYLYRDDSTYRFTIV